MRDNDSDLGVKIARMTQSLVSWAAKNPDDEVAQEKARRALDFYSEAGIFPALDSVEPLPAGEASGSNTDDADGTDEPGERRGRPLPFEILAAIVDCVVDDFEYRDKQNTLVALSVASRTLRNVAEPQLYRAPHATHMPTRQWLFFFSITVEPARARMVRELEFRWVPEMGNSGLLARIVGACPNTRVLRLERGARPYYPVPILRADVTAMAAILEAAPGVARFWYSTFTMLGSHVGRGRDDAEVARMLAEDARFATFARQLEDLSLSGQGQWLCDALVPHVTPALTSVLLGLELEPDRGQGFLTGLARASPNIRTLDACFTQYGPRDIAAACEIWAGSLQTLRLGSVDRIENRLRGVIAPLRSLRELHLRRLSCVGDRDIKAMPAVLPSQQLRLIRIDETALGTNYVAGWGADPDRVVASIVAGQSSTLECFHFNAREAPPMGRHTLAACARATRLRDLAVKLADDVTADDVDALLDACPRLAAVTAAFHNLSRRRGEWVARAEGVASEYRRRQEMKGPSLDLAVKGWRLMGWRPVGGPAPVQAVTG